jgi:diguanylate cyclase (GGDEF)-like protein/PAS domain S-box-containing protein
MNPSHEVKQEEDLWRALLDAAPAGVSIFSRDMRYLEVSNRWRIAYQMEDREVLGRTPYELFPEIPQKWMEVHRRCLAGAIERCEADPFPRADGRVDWLRWEVRPWHFKNGDIGGIVIFSEFITERIVAQQALHASEERFRRAMEASNDGVWDWDIASDKGYFSPGYFRMLGYEPDEFPMTGQAWVDLIHPEDCQSALSANQECIENRCESFAVEFRMKAKDGSWKWVLGRGRAFERNPDGRAVRMIGTHVDITERKQLEEKLREMARTDPLTGLANRRASVEAIETEFLRSKRFGSDAALLMIDIDHFKQINDACGHEAGDRALVSLATILRKVSRVTDLSARFGGEEFMLLLVNTDLSGAVEMAERIREAVAQNVVSFSTGNIAFTVSIGAASFTHEDENWSDAIRRADRAMYRAKELGRNTVVAIGEDQLAQ